MSRGAPARAPRVLIVEDDAAIRALACQTLEDEGYACVSARHGAEGLDLLRAEPFDLVLLDLMMPVLDGWGFRHAQLADPTIRHTPVLLMSATHNLGPSVDVMALDGMLAKPFDLDELADAVHRLVRRPQLSRAG